MPLVTSTQKMKSLVLARLLMGDINDWKHFSYEYKAACSASNRRLARGTAKSIGKNYKLLTHDSKKIFDDAFAEWNYSDIERICDDFLEKKEVYYSIMDFEHEYLTLTDKLKDRFPIYAYISISPYGMRFEYPEMHFFNDLSAAISTLVDVVKDQRTFDADATAPKSRREEAGSLVSLDKFLSRSVVIAGFNLLESFLSGVFFSAAHEGRIGGHDFTEEFRMFAKREESSAFLKRLKFVEEYSAKVSGKTVHQEILKAIEEGKRHRDAIHHTTPFRRKNLAEGERMMLLYSLDRYNSLNIGLSCVSFVSRTLESILGSDSAYEIKKSADKQIELIIAAGLSGFSE